MSIKVVKLIAATNELLVGITSGSCSTRKGDGVNKPNMSNLNKKTATWTVLHNKFSLKNKINNVATNLWQWLMTLGVEGESIEFCLKDFQDYVTKQRGKPFAAWWVKRQFELLENLRVVNVQKTFGKGWYRIQLKNPCSLKPKKKLTEANKTCEKESPKPRKSSEVLYSSSNSNIDDSKQVLSRCEILELCAKYGIYYNPLKKTTEKLYEFDIEDVKAALNHYEKRGGEKKIRDPKAWLIDCLINGYWIDDSFGLNEFINALALLKNSFSYVPDY